jgi:hypothetical protein
LRGKVEEGKLKKKEGRIKEEGEGREGGTSTFHLSSSWARFSSPPGEGRGWA